MRFRWKITYFPITVGAVIIAAYVLSVLEKGLYTWAVNSVVFLPGHWGATFTFFCLFILAISVIFRNYFSEIRLCRSVQGLAFLVLIALFLATSRAAAPIAPSLYGDSGMLSHFHVPRLRRELFYLIDGYLDRWLLTDPHFRFFRPEFTMPYLSLVLAAAYILTALLLVIKSLSSLGDRLAGLIIFAFYPFVLSFTGHWDSYSILITLLTAFLVFSYLAAKNRSVPLAIAATAALFFAIWEKQLAAVALLYPLTWFVFPILKSRRPETTIRVPVFLSYLGLVAGAGILLIVRGVSFGSTEPSFGRWFSFSISDRGIAATLFFPANTILPVILPLVVLAGALAVSPDFRREIFRSREIFSAFWVSLALAAGYYAMQLLNPVATYGTLDYLVHTGTLGSLIAVPIFVVAKSARNSLPSLAVLCIFLTVPRLILQTHPMYFTRLKNVLAQERWYMCEDFYSIHEHSARRIQVAPGPKGKEYVCGLLFDDSDAVLSHRRSEPLQWWYMILEEYLAARERKGSRHIRDFLTQRPETFYLLLALKPQRGNRLVVVPAMLFDTVAGAEVLFGKTGDEIYLRIIRLTEKLGTRRIFGYEELELAAALVWLDYLKYPGTPLPSDEVAGLAEQIIQRIEEFNGG